jgi:hypothetical protein
MTVDESDPCAAAATLRQAYYDLIAGERAMMVTFRAGSSGVERSATFHKGQPDRLLSVIRGFEQRCAEAEGRRPRRFAVRAGGIW